MVLFEQEAANDVERTTARIGYLFGEPFWGQGYATELVQGLVVWSRSQPQLLSLAGGVEHDNVASAQVLLKNGFAVAGPSANGEQLYELDLKA
ncbi:MAG: ribosomal-protein-alanine N-acetyltransferase [Acidimicrobiales bacterium]